MFDRPPPWIVGHRGVAAEALENSLASFELAVEQGADMIELDVQLTADGELVVFHDWTLERLAGNPEVVETSNRARLSALVPELRTLPETLEALPLEMPLNVELKRRKADAAAMSAALAAAVGERPRILVSSFDWALLERVVERLPERPVAPLAENGPLELLAAAERLGAWAIHCHHSMADRRLVDGAGERPLLAYTVNDPRLARQLFDRGVAGVFTDAAGLLRRQLERAPPED